MTTKTKTYNSNPVDINTDIRSADSSEVIIIPRWPHNGDYFYHINTECDIIHSTWSGSQEQENMRRFGNCFRTKEDAEYAQKKQERFMGL